jgi:hypothetical protein
MCVIAHVPEGIDLPDSEIQAMSACNADGIGIGWSTERGAQWIKGLDTDRAIEIVRQIDRSRSYVIHFRFATHGGDSALLTHPYILSRKSGLSLSGSATQILFHNGVWGNYASHERRLNLLGPSSDTRIMAAVIATTPTRKREKRTRQIAREAGKLAIIDAHGIKRYGQYHQGDGNGSTAEIWYSNLSWTYRPTIFSYGRNWKPVEACYNWLEWDKESDDLTTTPDRPDRQSVMSYPRDTLDLCDSCGEYVSLDDLTRGWIGSDRGNFCTNCLNSFTLLEDI